MITKTIIDGFLVILLLGAIVVVASVGYHKETKL